MILKELLDKSDVSRRTFLKGIAITGSAAAVAGCSVGGSTDTSVLRSTVESDDAITGGKGEWLPMFCYENCGGACVNRGYVVDGIIIRQKTDDAYPDTPGRPQMRSCPRGHSLRQQLYNVDRLKYPMKRKSWQPGGGANSNGHLRGKDEWERISWEQALGYVANELARVYNDPALGARSVVANAWRWENGGSLLKAAGGCTTNADVESFGTWGFVPALFGFTTIWGDHPNLQVANDRFDMVNADYIVLYGANPAWCQGNFPNYYFKQAQEAGVKFVSVSTSRNVSAAAYDAEWIPVRPGTDTAFLLAVIYEMIRLDNETGGDIIDQAFLDRCTVGFGLDNNGKPKGVPDAALTGECIKEYVLGTCGDNIPKTPAWASEICGTPVEEITKFARICGKNNKTMILHSYSTSRVNGAENMPQALLTVDCMGGNMGKSGHAFGSLFSIDCADSGPWLYRNSPRRGNPWVPNPLENCNIEGPSYWKAILEGKYWSSTKGDHTGMAGFSHDNTDESGKGIYYHKAKEITFNPKILFSYRNNFLQTRQNLKGGIEATRSVDLCISCDIKTTLTAQFADIILPISTVLEYNEDPEDGPLDWPAVRSYAQRRDCIRAAYPLVKPVYEARSDYWVLREIATRLGPLIGKNDLASTTFGVNNKVNFFDSYLSTEYQNSRGQWVSAFSFTAEDAVKYGVDNPPQSGAISFTQFIKDGCFTIERRAGDSYSHIGNKEFVDNPTANPRPSKSGKYELYCQLKADNYNIIEFNAALGRSIPDTVKPYANYIRPVYGYEDTFTDWSTKTKGAYPIQLYNNHYLRRAHTCYDNSEWLQEAFVNPVFMNASDAQKRGIKDGDTVMVQSEWGKTLRHAQLLESIMPGCAALPHGAHSVLDESNPNDIIDRGGNEQILYGPVHSNHFPQNNGYGSILVQIELYNGKPIPKDYDRGPFLDGAVAE